MIIPKRNEKDLVDVPDEVKKALRFHPVEHVDDVLKIALSGTKKTVRKSKAAK